MRRPATSTHARPPAAALCTAALVVAALAAAPAAHASDPAAVARAYLAFLYAPASLGPPDDAYCQAYALLAPASQALVTPAQFVTWARSEGLELATATVGVVRAEGDAAAVEARYDLRGWRAPRSVSAYAVLGLVRVEDRWRILLDGVTIDAARRAANPLPSPVPPDACG